MKKLLLIFIVVLFNSCGMLKSRSVDLQKQKVHFIDKSVIETTAPADKVFITLPATPKDRPKATTKRYEGSDGLKTDVTFDKDGNVTSISSDSPAKKVIQENNIESQIEIKTKLIDNEFNLEIAKIASKTTIWLGVILGIAWIVRAFIKK